MVMNRKVYKWSCCWGIMGKKLIEKIKNRELSRRDALKIGGATLATYLFGGICCGDDSGESINLRNNPSDDDDSYYGDDDSGNVGDCTTRYPHDSKYNVTICEDLGRDWKYGKKELGFCIDDYMNFPEKAYPHTHSVKIEIIEEWNEQLESCMKSNTPEDCIKQGTPNSENLRKILIGSSGLEQEDLWQGIYQLESKGLWKGMNNKFLLDGKNDRSLKITTISYEKTNSIYNSKEFIFEDPFVGEFKAMYLTPKTLDQHAAIIQIHGHGETPKAHIKNFGLEAYVKEGYSVLIPGLRATYGGEAEDKVSRLMLSSGLTFIGIQNYEIELAKKLLQYLPKVDNKNIFAVGHSGGSVILNTLIWTSKGIKAVVTDNASDYHTYGNGEGKIEFTQSLVPPLCSYYQQINDFNHAPIPVKKVDYGYPNGIHKDVLSFLKSHNSRK